MPSDDAGFDTVELALQELADGGMVVVVDDEDREDEGDLVMAAEHVTPADVAFMVRYGSGVVCVALTGERCDELDLPLMVGEHDTEQQRTAFTHTVDLAAGTTTGISAADRSATIRALADPAAGAGAFNRPGHVFPLRAREGGVLRRAGHTEAAVDLSRLAGLTPAGVSCEVVNDDGTMARRPDLFRFAAAHGLPITTIADLVEHRRRADVLVQRTGDARVPTPWGEFRATSYRSVLDGVEHVAFTLGDLGTDEELLVRVHSECLTGDVFRSLRCDCGPQLETAMARVAAEGRGAVVYLRGHGGRGIGLGSGPCPARRTCSTCAPRSGGWDTCSTARTPPRRSGRHPCCVRPTRPPADDPTEDPDAVDHLRLALRRAGAPGPGHRRRAARPARRRPAARPAR
jgi:3,4-dihydroxy 2-butanone 4-phosphate synthase/GTP cyclohydrolase II